MAERRATEPFAEEVRRLLAERGWSMRRLAREIEVDPTFISRVLNRRRYKTPTLRLTESVAQAFDLPPAYFAEYRELYLIERIKADPEIRDWLFGLLKSKQPDG